MTVCVGFLTAVGTLLVTAVVPFGIVPAAAGLWAARRGGAARFVPAGLFLGAAAWTGLDATPVDRPWIPTLLAITGLVWLPRSPSPFTERDRAWLSFATALSVLTVVMVFLFRSNAGYCGLV